jgi:DNA-binding NtrC family response regulator
MAALVMTHAEGRKGFAVATVLIVEDESQVLTLAESVLREAGYNAMTASTVAEAQAMIHSEAQFDLICTNVVLGTPDEGGITIGQ